MNTYKMTQRDIRAIVRAINNLPGIGRGRKEVGRRVYLPESKGWPDNAEDDFTNFRLVGGMYSDESNHTDLFDTWSIYDMTGEVELADDDPLVEWDVYIYYPDNFGIPGDLKGNVDVLFNTETKEITFGRNIYD